MPRGLIRTIALTGDRLYRASGGRLRGPMSYQDYATSAVESTLDTRKAERELGYGPVISWEDGLAELSAGVGGAPGPMTRPSVSEGWCRSRGKAWVRRVLASRIRLFARAAALVALRGTLMTAPRRERPGVLTRHPFRALRGAP